MMTGRAVAIVCLLLNTAAAGCVLGLGIAGLPRQASAAVYPHGPVQNSEAPWATDTSHSSQIDVQWAVRALDRLTRMQPPPPVLASVPQKASQPAPKPTRKAAGVTVTRVAAPMIVPRPSAAKRGTRPRIAVVIDDLGLNARRTRRLINLDGPLTLAFLPYGYNLRHVTEEAVSRGHEIFLHLPMEPLGDENPGPNALLEDLKSEEFERRMVWAFEQVKGIKGFNNHMGSRLTANPLAMERVMAEARKRKLLFLDSRTARGSVAFSTAEKFGVPAESRDIFLDHDSSAENIVRQFGKVERIARRSGQAIAIGHPYDTTYTVLKTWLKDAAERGYEVVPVSILIEESNVPIMAAAGAPAGAGRNGVRTSVQRGAE